MKFLFSIFFSTKGLFYNHQDWAQVLKIGHTPISDCCNCLWSNRQVSSSTQVILAQGENYCPLLTPTESQKVIPQPRAAKITVVYQRYKETAKQQLNKFNPRTKFLYYGQTDSNREIINLLKYLLSHIFKIMEKLSLPSQLLFVKLKAKIGTSKLQWAKVLSLVDPNGTGELKLAEFSQLVTYCALKSSNDSKFETVEIFEQICGNKRTVDVFWIYKILFQDKSQKVEVKKLIEDENKKMAKAALISVKKYIEASEDPVVLLKDYAFESNDSLSSFEFNQFLFCTDLSLLKDINMRKIAISSIFKDRMTLPIQNILNKFSIAIVKKGIQAQQKLPQRPRTPVLIPIAVKPGPRPLTYKVDHPEQAQINPPLPTAPKVDRPLTPRMGTRPVAARPVTPKADRPVTPKVGRPVTPKLESPVTPQKPLISQQAKINAPRSTTPKLDRPQPSKANPLRPVTPKLQILQPAKIDPTLKEPRSPAQNKINPTSEEPKIVPSKPQTSLPQNGIPSLPSKEVKPRLPTQPTNIVLKQEPQHSNPFAKADINVIPFPLDANLDLIFKQKSKNINIDLNSTNINMLSLPIENKLPLENFQAKFPKAMKYYRRGIPKSSEMKYIEQLEKLLLENRKYEDKQNPITSKGEYTPASTIFYEKSYGLFEVAASVFVREKSRLGIAQSIEPKDVIQGQLGDCYFLSSIAALVCKYAVLISDLFLFDASDAKYYGVRLFIDGEWKVIVTDDSFPCLGEHFPVFAKPHHNEIWVLMLEKCWAKVFGSYSSIESGNATEALKVLTGAPTEQITDLKVDTLMKQLKQIDQERYAATVSGSDYLKSLSDEQKDDLGLISSHSYSYIKTISINGENILKIRNPWGSNVWKKKWSFSSKEWTPELREKFNYTKDHEDGSFYMGVQDFLKYFNTLLICRINPTYLHTSWPLKHLQNKSQYVHMIVEKQGKYTLSVYQENKRKITPNMPNYEYSKARVILMKKEKGENQFSYVGSKASLSTEVCQFQAILCEGEYTVAVYVDWVCANVFQSKLVTYGPEQVLFSKEGNGVSEHFKKEMIRSFAQSHPGEKKELTEKLLGAYSEMLLSNESGIGYILIVNNSKKSLKITETYDLKRMWLIKPAVNPCKVELQPRESKLIGFYISGSGFSFSKSSTISYKSS